MATIKGIWLFNDVVNLRGGMSADISFISNNQSFEVMYEGPSTVPFVYTVLKYSDLEVCTGTVDFVDNWENDAYKIVDFGSTEQEVSDEFYTWFTANAVQQAEESPRLSGKWVFNETINELINIKESVSFVSDDITWDGIYVDDGVEFNPDVSKGIAYYIQEDVNQTYEGYASNEWCIDNYRTVDFGTTEQEVSDDFYTWFTANATQQTEEPTKTTITYNGTAIASLEAGQIATIKTAETEVEYDIVIKAAEQKDPVLQEKTVTENGEVIPNEGYDGLSKVTVNVPIPDGYIKPEGTTSITTNGTHDISAYASVEVNVKPKLQEKTIDSNGEITPDDGYDGLSKVTVNVPEVAEYDGTVVIE